MKTKKIFIAIVLFIAGLALLSAMIALFQREVPFKGKIALVRVEGPILTSKSIVEEIRGYVKDRTIKAIVLRVDSPGGGVVASQEIYDEVRRATATKKVIASMGAVAASGGYYISSPATTIIANPGTITGSIGVIMEVPNIKGLMDKLGVTTEVIKSGRYKDMASVFRGIGRDQREILQGVMDDIHQQFIAAVADSRKIPIDELKKIADGRIFSGQQAVKVGLVDELGDLDDAIKTAGKLADITGEPEVVSKKDRSTIMELLSGNMTEKVLEALPHIQVKYMLAP